MQYIPVKKIMMVRDSSLKVETKRVSTPGQASEILRAYIGDTDREQVVTMILDTKNIIIAINTVSIGSLNASIIHPREIFKPAILANAASIIIGHNHPSGDPKPSQQDLEITRRLVDAGNIIGVAVRDHIIIGEGIWFSFREKGILP